MISYDDIKELQQYKSSADAMVLSLYLDVDQSRAANLNRRFETTVENLCRKLGENNSSPNGNSRLAAECDRILRFIREYVPHGKSLVVFSDSARGFWWQRDLQVHLPTDARWSSKPWLRPLLDVLEDTDRFAAVLIDKHRARILTVDATGINQRAEIISDVPPRHTTTGTDHMWSQSNMERDHINHIKLHARKVVEELSAFLDALKISRLVIGGPVEATSMFISELPKRLQRMVIGTVSISVDAPEDRVHAELREVQHRSEQQDESRMVESMITAAKKGDRAVLGVADTLEAIHQGRVYRLVVASNYRTEGKECRSCHVLVESGEDSCSFCGGQLEPAPDLINRASHRVIEQAGRVQLVSGEAASKLAGTGVGAILRF